MPTTTITSKAGKVYQYPQGRYGDSGRKDNRRNANKSGSFKVAKIWENHHEIARLLVLGCKGPEIAERLNCSTQTVSNVRNSPVVKEKIALMVAARDAGTIELAKEIQDMAPIALIRIKEAIETGVVLGKECSAANILKESNALIDRAEGKAIQRVDTRNLHGHFTITDIERIKDKAKELAGLSGILAEEAV